MAVAGCSSQRGCRVPLSTSTCIPHTLHPGYILPSSPNLLKCVASKQEAPAVSRYSPMAQAMPTPSAEEVARPSSSMMTRLREVALGVCGGRGGGKGVFSGWQ